jgi:hypothetical protein
VVKVPEGYPFAFYILPKDRQDEKRRKHAYDRRPSQGVYSANPTSTEGDVTAMISPKVSPLE